MEDREEQHILHFPAQRTDVEGPLVERSEDAEDGFRPLRSSPEKISAWAGWVLKRMEEVGRNREKEEKERGPLVDLPIPDELHCEGRMRSFRELLEETGRTEM